MNPSLHIEPAMAEPTAPDPTTAVPRYLTRQPVLDSAGHIVGHCLELRGEAPLPVLPGAHGEARVRDEALLVGAIDLDFSATLGQRTLFLPIHGESLDNPLLDHLPRERVALIPAATALAEAGARLAAMAAEGWRIVLDFDTADPAAAALLPACHYARLDLARHDPIELAARLDSFHAAGVQALTLARGVDTEEQFEAARRLRFDLLQGYHFTRPRTGTKHRLDSNRMRVVDLLNRVARHAEIRELEDGFKHDAALALRLMRFTNSPAIGLRQPIKSIAHALVILGHDQLYRWLSLLLFAGGQGSPREQALLRNALVRARLAEQLGQAGLGRERAGTLFIVGMLSMLDALLDQPLAEALAGLRLEDEVVAALLRGEGPYADYLALAIACERYDQACIDRCAATTGLTPEEINLAHIDALVWAEGLDF